MHARQTLNHWAISPASHPFLRAKSMLLSFSSPHLAWCVVVYHCLLTWLGLSFCYPSHLNWNQEEAALYKEYWAFPKRERARWDDRIWRYSEIAVCILAVWDSGFRGLFQCSICGRSFSVGWPECVGPKAGYYICGSISIPLTGGSE
jgi:hypothetical protein